LLAKGGGRGQGDGVLNCEISGKSLSREKQRETFITPATGAKRGRVGEEKNIRRAKESRGEKRGLECGGRV